MFQPYLYVSIGDGGGANDVGLGHPPEGNGQNTATLLGKILRIDVDNSSEDMAYAIPEDNPFVDTEGFRPEIFAYGLRNAYQISFDSGGDLELFAADVGQNLWEEVNIITKGENYPSGPNSVAPPLWLNWGVSIWRRIFSESMSTRF